MKKIFDISITLFGVVTIIFFLFNVLPGDPAQMMLGQNENSEQLNILKKKYGFDKPVFKQYLYYLNDLSIVSIHSKDPVSLSYLKEGKYSYLDLIETKKNKIVLKTPYLRDSYQKNGLSVSEIIKNTLPNTVVLAVSAISIAIIFGLLLGIFSALNKNTWIDYSIQIFSTLGMSIPSFFSAIIFAWFFGYVLSDLTGLNMTGSLYELDNFGEKMSLQLKNLILPSIVSGIRPIAVISQMMRNSLLKVLTKNYITTAYAKGLSKFDVIKNHAIKNSLNLFLIVLLTDMMQRGVIKVVSKINKIEIPSTPTL